MQTAEEYRVFRWFARPEHAFHGTDEDGIRVDTPDSAFDFGEPKQGLWTADVYNTGMPYKWGGFSTPEQFLAGLEQGKYAGDLLRGEQRSEITAASVGIDCSGLVSRCWELETKRSSGTLKEI